MADLMQRIGQYLMTGGLPAGYTPETAPAGMRPAYEALQPNPDSWYGSLVPAAYNRPGTPSYEQQGTNLRFAMPETVRGGLHGLADLLSGTETGQLTAPAAQSMTLGSMGTAMGLAPRGAIGMGGAPFTRQELNRIVPAVRIEDPAGNVKIYHAKRGETHEQAAEKVPFIADTSGHKFNDGFYDPKSGQYYTRDQMSERMGPREANDLRHRIADYLGGKSGGEMDY